MVDRIHDHHMEEPLILKSPTWDQERFESWRRDSIPKLHVASWIHIYGIGDGLGMLRDLIVFL